MITVAEPEFNSDGGMGLMSDWLSSEIVTEQAQQANGQNSFEIGCELVTSNAAGNLVLSGTIVDVDPEAVVTNHGVRRYLVDPDPTSGLFNERIKQRRYATLKRLNISFYIFIDNHHIAERDDMNTARRRRRDRRVSPDVRPAPGRC
jgi:hypothetical protein